MKNPVLVKWEARLRKIFDEIDHHLEQEYEGKFILKPNRQPAGEGVTPDTDGLFGMSVAFSPGFRSKLGPGYVFRVNIATLCKVPECFRKEIEEKVINMLSERLPDKFPGRDLKVSRDGELLKIHGDLDLN